MSRTAYAGLRADGYRAFKPFLSESGIKKPAKSFDLAGFYVGSNYVAPTTIFGAQKRTRTSTPLSAST